MQLGQYRRQKTDGPFDARHYRIASVPPISAREAAEDALKQINHEMCMRLLSMGEANARRAAMLRELAPELHDDLVQELRDMNNIAIGAAS